MKRIDLQIESENWEHQYRIQVTKPLRKWEIWSIIESFAAQRVNCAIEKRNTMFVIWREPEQEWDVDDATPEWLDEWTSQIPPSLENFVKEYRFDSQNGDEENMPISDNRLRRDEAIRAEFAEYKKQGFQSGHIYRVLAEKYFLSPYRIRDIVTLSREKRLKSSK